MLYEHCSLFTRLDDPLDAVAVHGGGGVVGLLAVPFFMSVNLEVQCANDSYNRIDVY